MSTLTDWPIQQIGQTVQPEQAQRAALNDLRDATAKGLDVLQSACPNELPSIVKPALDRFYDSLTDQSRPLQPDHSCSWLDNSRRAQEIGRPILHKCAVDKRRASTSLARRKADSPASGGAARASIPTSPSRSLRARF